MSRRRPSRVAREARWKQQFSESIGFSYDPRGWQSGRFPAQPASRFGGGAVSWTPDKAFISPTSSAATVIAQPQDETKASPYLEPVPGPDKAPRKARRRAAAPAPAPAPEPPQAERKQRPHSAIAAEAELRRYLREREWHPPADDAAAAAAGPQSARGGPAPAPRPAAGVLLPGELDRAEAVLSLETLCAFSTPSASPTSSLSLEEEEEEEDGEDADEPALRRRSFDERRSSLGLSSSGLLSASATPSASADDEMTEEESWDLPPDTPVFGGRIAEDPNPGPGPEPEPAPSPEPQEALVIGQHAGKVLSVEDYFGQPALAYPFQLTPEHRDAPPPKHAHLYELSEISSLPSSAPTMTPSTGRSQASSSVVSEVPSYMRPTGRRRSSAGRRPSSAVPRSRTSSGSPSLSRRPSSAAASSPSVGPGSRRSSAASSSSRRRPSTAPRQRPATAPRQQRQRRRQRPATAAPRTPAAAAATPATPAAGPEYVIDEEPTFNPPPSRPERRLRSKLAEIRALPPGANDAWASAEMCDARRKMWMRIRSSTLLDMAPRRRRRARPSSAGRPGPSSAGRRGRSNNEPGQSRPPSSNELGLGSEPQPGEQLAMLEAHLRETL